MIGLFIASNWYIYYNYTDYVLNESGDLSRISYDFSYKKYDRNLIQEELNYPNITIDQYSSLDIEKPYVLTIGDSFMNGANEKTWLQNQMGIEKLVHLNERVRGDFLSILEKIKDNPPKYLLLERVERGISKTYTKEFQTKTVVSVKKKTVMKQEEPNRLEFFKFINSANYKFIVKYFFDFKSDNFFINQLKKTVLKLGGRKKELENDGFFSVEGQTLFFSNEDFKTKHINQDILKRIVDNYVLLNKQLKSYGTKLIVMVVPDKLTVYGPYLKKPIEKLFYDKLYYALNSNDILSINLKEYLQKQVKNTPDLYQPDDTHFSKKGTKIIGQYIGKQINKIDKQIKGE